MMVDVSGLGMRLFLLNLLLSAAACSSDSATSVEAVKDTRPNFLIILVDDLGYADLGSFGSEVIMTPNIDRLASQGARFTDFYASAPMCSPSRAGLLTGRTPYRFGVYDWIPPEGPTHLPQSEITIATLLQNAGYSTAHIGKWHLNGLFNSAEQPQPDDHGFDYWFGVQYSQPHLNPKGFYRNGTPVETPGYAAQIVADEAIEWLNSAAESAQPFFQFVNFLEPHEPIMSPPDLVEHYAEYGIKAEYYANVTHLDQAIGRILDSLGSLGLSENTVVLFTSDNGPAQYTPDGYFNKSHGSAAPFKGYKRHMFEGGIRVPAVVRWPGHVDAGSTVSEPVSNVDIMPTLAAIAGVETPQDRIIDGASFSPSFSGESIDRETPLHWHFFDPWGGPQSLLREGDWILAAYWDVGIFHEYRAIFNVAEIETIRNSKLERFELYNIRDDEHQDSDISATNPERFASMKTTLIELHQSVMSNNDAD
jgi:arylsulfatase A